MKNECALSDRIPLDSDSVFFRVRLEPGPFKTGCPGEADVHQSWRMAGTNSGGGGRAGQAAVVDSKAL